MNITLRIPVRSAIAAAALILAGAARGQYPAETITYSIEWEKTVIAPGEANTATVRATITPEIGTLCHWNSGGGGTGQPGVLKAFASTIFDFVSVSGADKGTIVEALVPTEFAIAPDPITPVGTTGVKVKAGQYAFPINPNPNVNQSVAVLSFTWLAGDAGQAYEVLYQTQAVSGKVYLDVGLAVWVGDNTVKVNGQGGFSVTPSPASWAAYVPLLLIAGQRRRKP